MTGVDPVPPDAPLAVRLAHAEQLAAAIQRQGEVLGRLAERYDAARQAADHAGVDVAIAAATLARARDAETGARTVVRTGAIAAYVRGPSPPSLIMTIDAGVGPSRVYASAVVAHDQALLAAAVQARRHREEAVSALGAAQRAATATVAQVRDQAAAAAQAQAQQQAYLVQLQGEVSQLVAARDARVQAAARARLAPVLALAVAPNVPAGAVNAGASRALGYALAQLGKPYLWGGNGPDAYDCSGLTQQAWRAAGVAIPRVAADQQAWTTPVAYADAAPGDLVFFGVGPAHHVALYLGNDQVVEAPNTGAFVRIGGIWRDDLAGFGRVPS